MSSNRDGDASLPGYGDYSVMHEDGYSVARLLLPNHTVQELHDERRAAEAAQKAKEEDSRQSTKEVNNDRWSASPSPRKPLRSDADRKFNRMRPSMARILCLETRSAKAG